VKVTLTLLWHDVRYRTAGAVLRGRDALAAPFDEALRAWRAAGKPHRRLYLVTIGAVQTVLWPVEKVLRLCRWLALRL
jgi:hypothetical protein